MHCNKTLTFFPLKIGAIVGLFILLNVISNVKGKPTISPQLSFPQTNYLKAFKHFSNDLITLDPDSYKTSGKRNIIGATGLAPYGVGQLLALLSEQTVWSIPGKNEFQKATRLSTSQMTDAYEFIRKEIDNSKIYTFSNIFTPEELTSTSGLEQLDTMIVNMTDIWDRNAAALLINAQIGFQTFGHILGDEFIVPSNDWFDSGVNIKSRAVFVDTMSYSTEWNSFTSGQFKNIGKQKFGKDGFKTDFISFDGAFGYYDDKKFSSVGILLDDLTTFVMVQPKSNIDNVTTTDLKELFKSPPQGWESSSTSTIQFPALNLSMYGTSMSQLKKMGVDSTFCSSKTQNEEHVLKQISQRIYLQVDTKGVVAASATGVVLNHNEGFTSKKLISTSQNELQKEKERQEDDFSETGRTRLPKSLNKQQPELIKFDQPFFWYINDLKLGPLYFGSVLSFKNYQDLLTSEEYEVIESLESISHWSCDFINPYSYYK